MLITNTNYNNRPTKWGYKPGDLVYRSSYDIPLSPTIAISANTWTAVSALQYRGFDFNNNTTLRTHYDFRSLTPYALEPKLYIAAQISFQKSTTSSHEIRLRDNFDNNNPLHTAIGTKSITNVDMGFNDVILIWFPNILEGLPIPYRLYFNIEWRASVSTTIKKIQVFDYDLVVGDSRAISKT